MWPLSSREVAARVGGELLGSEETRCERVTSDSRSGIRAGDLFVGLVGPHFDGGRFAAQALAEGAGAALVEQVHRETPFSPGQALILVEDPLAALHRLAAEARRRFGGRLLAITGSNGKTTVKDMLAAILGREHRVYASPRSFNSQVGVALSLLALDPEAEIALIECGVSLPGEMVQLEAMVRPDCGILTMIGDAHLAGLGTRETTAREKSQLFRRLAERSGWVLTQEGERLGREALEAVGAQVLTVGPAGSDLELRLALSPPEIRVGGQTARLPLGEPAPHWLEDAALAAGAALLLGASTTAVEEGLASWQPAPMRLEISTTPRGILLLNDAYAADPVSMEAALSELQRERGPGRTVAVLGGMAQLGPASRAAHARVGRRVAELGIDRLIGVGAGGAEIAEAALAAGLPAERAAVAASADDAASLLEEQCRPGDRVLLKASRPERLERIAALLFDSVASARLSIDLDELVGNFHRIRRAVGPGCAVMAVVKSFGYGLDSLRLARALGDAGADYFAVAYPDEGVLLRDHGITAPILVQNLLAHEADKIVGFGLSAQVSSREQAEWLNTEAARQQRAVRVHLKIDTGMGRGGAAASEALDLARALEAAPWLVFEGLMTHFAAADDPTQDAFTREQIRRFDLARSALTGEGFRFRYEHAAASAAIARFPEAHYTMVRTGLALFGYSQVPELVPLGQRPVLRLTTQVISVKELPAGHGVGYGLTFTTPEARRIAIVALGYSDGYPWALSNLGWMLVGGARCPVVGRVSMDVTAIDVSAVRPPVAPGDEVVVFGPDSAEPSVGELARLAGTIPYELLTRISPRVRRIFRTSR